MADQAFLSMEGITKSFGGPPVLKDVDFYLNPGEVHILAGENGAGKSTLIKILAGVHTDYEGNIKMEGNFIHFDSPHVAACAGISVIHQELSLVPTLSVMDNIFLGREQTLRGGWINTQSQSKFCTNLLARLNLDVDIHTPIEELPISIQQMIEIARAVAFEAKIIIMDEPTSALSEPEVKRLFSLISDLRKSGKGVVYISHKMDEIYQIGDQITVLRDGESVYSAPITEFPRDELIQKMVGRKIEEQFPNSNAQIGQEKLRVEHFTVPDPKGIRKPVVEDISLRVKAGEILGIAGLAGSGNSELLWGLFGAFGKSVMGKIYLDGKLHEVISPSHSIKNGLALLTNDRKTTGLISGMNILQNITLASIPRFSAGAWLRKNQEIESAERQKTSLRIKTNNISNSVTTLSGGNQQKVVLAKWLETQPKVLLLDEPTRGVDVGAKHEIYEMMNQWTSEGYAILLITSEMPELLALSHRIIVMHRGKITAEFERKDATQENIVRAAMGYITWDN